MSRKERVKYSLDFAKSLIFALLTALFGIFAFIVINVSTINTMQITASLLGIIIIALFFYFLIRYMIKALKELERLD
ncbi:hypothetical protein [Campylobacter vulpis]|uniref:hypothetical protein n=1 Tax=Campylobacter vulpis TaxID=1655500 RepID=UPI000C14B5B6|nr:hypothetical protein [Campylobacter vulpis]MBS4275585.1 hypothetical protein [Campylobacter vulpis]MBS4306831.1 hypothetical protein [Campylobacter vulpis]MBS4329941.1 hypothetical protein [Campylobacter vulpis]MBS4423588.1 hypothetical protein [Campylobacter vulpis]PHY89929.1 hypothetical protein AA995_07265 [Campylobacter vulpis]